MTSLDLTLPQRLSDAARQARRQGDEARLDPDDLAELIRAFNEITSRLQQTHETLTAEVGRLQRELSATNEQLRRAQELAALGEMAAGIAHEIRNPLGSIRLYASMLEQDLPDRPEQRRTAEKIAHAVRGLNAIVTDVLTFAREMRVEPAPVQAGTLLARAVDACRDEFQQAGVEPPILDKSETATKLHCDAGLAHQALVNVFRNAAEAAGASVGRAAGPSSSPCRDGGAAAREPRVEVDISTRHVRDSSGRTRSMAAIAVRDTGLGVSDEVKRRMFNPFFTTRQSGAGLGLAIVHRIMDAHGGRVVARNHEDGGAVFELFFPTEPDEQTHADDAAQSAYDKEASHEHRPDR